MREGEGRLVVVDTKVLAPVASSSADDPEWSAVSLWLRSVSMRAREEYAKDLQQFMNWAADRGISRFQQVTRKLVLDWRDDLEQQNLAPATVARKLSCLRRCFAELQNDAEHTGISGNPVAGVHGHEKVSTTSPRHALKNQQALALLDAPDRATLKGARDYAVLMLLLYLGLRRSEVSGLTTSSIEETPDGRIVRIRGKGSKVRVLPLPPHVMEALRCYLQMDGCAEALDAGQPSRPLFRPIRNPRFHQTDRSITPRAVWQIVDTYTQRAKVRAHVCPHELRHTAITNTILGGVPLHRVQEMAGHADIRTTMWYKTQSDAIRYSAVWAVNYEREDTTAAG